MYNRYIPQPDGSYRRSRVPDPVQRKRQMPPPAPTPEPAAAEPIQPKDDRRSAYSPAPRQEKRLDGSVSGFLRQLLPKDFDIGDLMIVLLLLVMAGDSQEDQNTAMLTLALYLFM